MAHYLDESSPLFKSLGLLKTHDIDNLQLAVLMYRNQTGTFPQLRSKHNLSRTWIHNYNTRLSYRYQDGC